MTFEIPETFEKIEDSSEDWERKITCSLFYVDSARSVSFNVSAIRDYSLKGTLRDRMELRSLIMKDEYDRLIFTKKEIVEYGGQGFIWIDLQRKAKDQGVFESRFIWFMEDREYEFIYRSPEENINYTEVIHIFESVRKD